MKSAIRYANIWLEVGRKSYSTLVDKTQPRLSRMLDTVTRPERY